MPAAERLDSPVTTYYVLLGSTLLLLVIGLVMVLSASSVTSLSKSGSSFTVFLEPAALRRDRAAADAGRLPACRCAGGSASAGSCWSVRSPRSCWSSPGSGVSVNGNRNWIELGGQRLQPSEALKLALVLWGAAVLARKRLLLDRWVHVLVPVLVPVGVLAIGLVLAGHDLGTALVLLMILGALLFAAGAPGRMFLFAGAAMAGLVAVMVTSSANRMHRIESWLGGGSCADTLGTCYQSIHGKYALADGGWWGVGLGASREKWSWLPEAHNDFIFAIIGEELGLPGVLVVLALFLLIGWACLRLVTRSDDMFVRIASAATMAWLLGQTLINVGAVIGMLPVIGLPLPLVSSGGSALVTSMLVLGMLMAFARAEPGAAEALRRARRTAAVARSRSCRQARARRLVTTSVLLAGGGTAGHVSPLLALADCLRRRDPATRITVLGTAEGLEARLVPGARLRAAAPSRRCRCRAVPARTWCGCPAGCRSAVRAAADAVRSQRGGRRRRLRRLRGRAGLPRRAPARRADRRARAEPAARRGQPARRPADPVRGHHLRRHPAAARRAHRDAAAPADQRPGRPRRRRARRAPGRGPGRPRPGPGPPDPAGHRRVAGRAAAQRDVRRRRAGACGRPACRCCTSAAPASTCTSSRAGRRPGAAPYVVLPYLDRMDDAYLAADLVVCRAGANTVCELATAGLPAAYVPLPIGNGEQRLNAEPVVAAGGGLLVDDAGCTPGLGARGAAAAAGGPEPRWRSMAEAATPVRRPGRRRAARRPRARRGRSEQAVEHDGSRPAT